MQSELENGGQILNTNRQTGVIYMYFVFLMPHAKVLGDWQLYC